MKKAFALLLAALMLLSLLAACGSQPAADPTPTPAEDSASASATPASDEPDTSTDTEGPMSNTGDSIATAENQSGTFAGASERNESGVYSTGGLTLPLTDEPLEYSIFSINLISFYGLEDNNQVACYAEAEKRTGVHINWALESFATAQEKFNLSIVSGDYYDSYDTGNVFNASSWYIGGYDKYIDDGVIIDLNNLLPANAPNYWALANANDTARRSTRTDDGAMPFMRTINVDLSLEPSWQGMVVRNDLLRQTGIDYSTVNAIDEYHEMLTALKPYCDTPLLIPATGYDDNLLAAWNLNFTYFQKDGNVIFGPAAPEFKDYLKTLRQWYEEGLISKDFTTTDTSARNNMMYNGEVAVFQGGYASPYEYPALSTIEGYELKALYNPVLAEGQIRHVNKGTIPGTFCGGGNFTISTACQNPETLVSWLDYWYCEEGFYLGNYGVEGVSWDWHEGFDRPTFTDWIEDNPDGKTNNEMRFSNAAGPFHAKLYDWRVGYYRKYGPDAMDIPLKIWDADFDNAWSMPEVAVTQAESEEYARAYNDVKTYADEMTLKFITGVEDIDAGWDKYIATLENFGLQTMLDIQQAALERYYQK